VWDKLERYIAFTFWVNMTGQPAMSLPLAWSLNGLPIGVQIIGRQLEEATLLGLAGQLEQALPWRHRLPTVAQ
jgi:amidase